MKGPPHPKGRIPETHRALLRQRLERHVEQHWSKECGGILLRFRGPYAYVDALPAERDDPEWLEGDEPGGLEATPLQLCRLGYLGSNHRWAFAFYKYSDECYEPSILPSGQFAGEPEEAFDCAAAIYLAGGF